MLWRTQPWFLWINVWKTCLVKLLPWLDSPALGTVYLHTLVRNFIRSERTGDWPLHLDTFRKMLPFFHASGHLRYAKSAHLYHQEMCSLHDVMDKNEFQAYTEKGFFTIRRSDRFWSGVWLSWYVLCHCVYHCALQVKSSLAGILSPLSGILRHLITKTWDKHNRLVTRQIWSSSSSGLKHIHHFPGIMVTSYFHSLLASLVTPHWLAIMQRKLVSSSSNRWLEKALLMSKWTGRVRWKL